MTAKIITVFNQKGGAGKTSVSMQLAGTLGRWGYKVRLLDMDRQNSASGWAAASADKVGEAFPADVSNKAPFGKSIHIEIAKIAEDCDFVFVDCPPAMDSPVAASSLVVADLAIIPIIPKPMDVAAASPAKLLALQIKRDSNPDLRLLAVANQVKSSSNTVKELVVALDSDTELPLAATRLTDRIVYAECAAYGTTVHSFAGARAAIKEVDALTNEVLVLLGVKQHG